MNRLPLQSVFVFSGLVIAFFAISGCDSSGAPAAATVTITPPPVSAVESASVPAVSAIDPVLPQASPTPCTDAPSSLPAP